LAALVRAASRVFGETMIVLFVFTTYASKQTAQPFTLTTFLVPNARTIPLWTNHVPREFFLVGCALLFLSLALDAARNSLDKPVRGDAR
jgi:ABC-type phosphate transport system permease subunit